MEISGTNRTYWKADLQSESNMQYDDLDRHMVPYQSRRANLVASLSEDGLHRPVLDIDFPAELIPSTTPGHFHLYLNKPMTWDKYQVLLRALADAGVIEEGFAACSVKRGMSYVRTPETKKTFNGTHEDTFYR